MTFLAPIWWWLVLPAATLMWWRWRSRGRSRRVVTALYLWREIAERESPRGSGLPGFPWEALVEGALVLVLIATLAAPQWSTSSGKPEGFVLMESAASSDRSSVGATERRKALEAIAEFWGLDVAALELKEIARAETAELDWSRAIEAHRRPGRQLAVVASDFGFSAAFAADVKVQTLTRPANNAGILSAHIEDRAENSGNAEEPGRLWAAIGAAAGFPSETVTWRLIAADGSELRRGELRLQARTPEGQAWAALQLDLARGGKDPVVLRLEVNDEDPSDNEVRLDGGRLPRLMVEEGLEIFDDLGRALQWPTKFIAANEGPKGGASDFSIVRCDEKTADQGRLCLPPSAVEDPEASAPFFEPRRAAASPIEWSALVVRGMPRISWQPEFFRPLRNLPSRARIVARLDGRPLVAIDRRGRRAWMGLEFAEGEAAGAPWTFPLIMARLVALTLGEEEGAEAALKPQAVVGDVRRSLGMADPPRMTRAGGGEPSALVGVERSAKDLRRWFALAAFLIALALGLRRLSPIFLRAHENAPSR